MRGRDMKMKILGFDTSANVASVAYVKDNDLICEYTLNYKLTHSLTLMPMLEEICKSCDLNLQDMDAIAVSSGPGSFTGLRIGAATAKGLAHGLNKEIVPVPTLDGLAYNIHYTEHLICPMMDARRQQVYTALYHMEEDKLVKETDDLAIPAEELLASLEQKKGKIIFVGDGVSVHKERIVEVLGERALFAPAHLNRQRAGAIATLGMIYYDQGKAENYKDHGPTYVRQAQAQREYDEKMRQKNGDNKEA